MKSLKILCFFVVFLVIVVFNGSAQTTVPNYYQHADFLLASPGAFQNSLLGFVNPAASNFIHSFDTYLYLSTDYENRTSVDRWGLFTGAPHIGFGVIHEDEVTDYRFNVSGGNDAFAMGMGYGWSGGNAAKPVRENIFSLGSMIRPNPYMSLGMTGHFSTEGPDRAGIFDLAVRPFGTDFMTLFGDCAFRRKDNLDDLLWSAGAVVHLLPGIHLTGRYFESDAFTVGISLNLGTNGLSSQARIPDNGDIDRIYYGIRMGGLKRNVIDTHFRQSTKFVATDMKGRIEYQKFRFFDQSTHTLQELLSDLDGVIEDGTVGAVALNFAKFNVSREMAWEIREKLKRVRTAGKKVYVFMELAGITHYHLASVADKIILDPEGIIMLEGYVMGRTYLKGTLEKLGLGFDEWRYFKYKSAAETFSRESMSDADREQRQALIDELFRVVRDDICSARNFSRSEFDSLMNNKIAFDAEGAVEFGLVDTTGRWVDMDKIIKKFDSKLSTKIKSEDLAKYQLPPEKWGAKPQIAVVYGIGVCDMEMGIRARKLQQVFTKLEKDDQIKAVVFRVDSPGGDGMASDIVAEAMKKCAEKKPVIVSQGYVAASGGYWISMYADTIVAAPFTITGSIGVIGGWLWNKTLGEKLGMTSDFVKAGEHADLGFGITLPLLGLQVPHRNLNEEEQQRIETLIRDMYQGFVAKVAKGRNLPKEEVLEIAQGRVWTGTKGKEIGLVDEIGGLETSLMIAREAAGIPVEKKVDIKEYPEPELFNLEMFDVFPFSDKEKSAVDESAEISYIKFISKNSGKPLPLAEPEFFDDK
ncbi:signal peptide peptidase SppA [candidate division KSB1 bacterium]|nr:signal peptide peptidase SppA [candidate division KSB1 bacterium]